MVFGFGSYGELITNVDNCIKLAKFLFPQGQMWMGGSGVLFSIIQTCFF